MANSLAQLTDAYAQPETIDGLPVESVPIDIDGVRRVRINTSKPEPDPALSDFNISVGTKLDDILNKLTGANGQERYQLWPEKVIRGGLTAAGDVLTGNVPQWTVDKDTGEVHTSPQMIEKAQEISALAGTGGLAGADATLGSTAFLRPALKYKDKLYKGKEGQQHLDVIPKDLYPEFERMAMSGEDLTHYNFGFMNHKGQFLDREKALEYAINEGIVDAHAGQYGALTSTLMADSSKPGMAIEAMGKTASPFFSALEHNVSQISQAKMTGDQWLGTLSNKPGVKPEELQWTGLGEFLKENAGKSVTKAQIEEHLANNKVELKEVSKGQSDTHFLHYKEDLEHNLRRFDSLLPEFKSISDIALARQHNPHFKETVKGETDETVWKAIQEAKKPLSYPKELFKQYDTRAEAEAAIKTAGAENHLNISKKQHYSDTKYHGYQLPGGENYREMLLTLPPTKNIVGQFKVINEHGHVDSTWTDKAKAETWATKNNYTIREDKPVTLDGGYKSSHWNEPNVLAHVRMNDRTIDGKKSLHLEEIQSDWHQQGRDKGYQIKYKPEELKPLSKNDPAWRDDMIMVKSPDNVFQISKSKASNFEEAVNYIVNNKTKSDGVPDAPFKKSWHELALKRMIREAAEKGYDRLSWTTGEAQTARYDLSKSISKVELTGDLTKGAVLKARDLNNKVIISEKINDPSKIADYIGKEAAKKLIEQESDGVSKSLEGLDLKIGGEGMKGFYDQIIPKVLEKIGKEHGVKVKQSKIPISKEYGGIKQKNINEHSQDVNYIDIPQSLKDQAMHKGFPLFSKGGHMLMPVDHEPDFGDKK